MLRGMRVIAIPCLKDNYAYLLIDDKGRTIVVDPSEAPPVAAALEREGVTLAGIWLTHHHWDHVGGVEHLCAASGAADIEVLGSAYDLEHARIPRQTRGLREGDQLSFGGQRVDIVEIPGHTLGAIAYVVDGAVFSGDTLFIAGCGRVFEGSMAMMQQSLAKLRSLPKSTRIYCGHEYTLANLRFAHTIEPQAPGLEARLSWAATQRERGEPTVPGLLQDELAHNPFLRWDQPSVIAAARDRGASDNAPPNVFAAIRTAKDNF
jgi:hydroxyacylglutathione hydrolase